MGGSWEAVGFDGDMKEKKDCLGGWRDSMVGWTTVGCCQVESMLCRSSRFLMMPGLVSLCMLLPSRMDVVLLWCSSSRNRPELTRSSYSAMGPYVFSGSFSESALISITRLNNFYLTYTPAQLAHILYAQLGLPAPQQVEVQHAAFP